MPNRQIRIGLLWHSLNSGNLGVGALTVANLALARAAATRLGLDAEYLVIGMHDTHPDYVAGPDVEMFKVNTRALMSPRGYWRTLGTLDCILDIGAGDSFCEIYGFWRFWFLWLTKALAYWREVPFFLSPQTIGPFLSWPYKRLAGYAMARADGVAARDRQSFAAVRTLAPSAAAYLSTDVAFALPFENRRMCDDAGRPVRVGINVSGMLFHEAVVQTNRYGLDVDYAALMRRFLHHLTDVAGVELHLVAHVNKSPFRPDDGSHPDNDSDIADALAREFPTAIRVPDFPDPVAAKSYISSLDFLVAGRMHACIAAYSSGTPMVPVAYSRKFTGLFEQLNYKWIVPVKGISTDEALAYLIDCFHRRAELRACIEAGMPKVAALIVPYREALEKLFARVARAT